MYDYKSLRKIVVLLAVLFGVVLAVLVLTSLPLNKFALLSVVLMVVVGIYFVTIPLKLLKEMKDMEAIIEKYKRGNSKQD
ncbi:MAG: hypothetical protein IJZ09_03775 [Tidjanibacter sp.]|nr:hypothetical protein [Tidjanibacter sp.]